MQIFQDFCLNDKRLPPVQFRNWRGDGWAISESVQDINT